MIQTNSNEQKILSRAYGIWQSEGCPHGRELDHWLAAEREIMSRGSAPLTATSMNAPAEPVVKSRDSQAVPVSHEAPAAAQTSDGRTRKSALANPGKKRSPPSHGKKSLTQV